MTSSWLDRRASRPSARRASLRVISSTHGRGASGERQASRRNHARGERLLHGLLGIGRGSNRRASMTQRDRKQAQSQAGVVAARCRIEEEGSLKIFYANGDGVDTTQEPR